MKTSREQIRELLDNLIESIVTDGKEAYYNEKLYDNILAWFPLETDKNWSRYGYDWSEVVYRLNGYGEGKARMKFKDREELVSYFLDSFGIMGNNKRKIGDLVLFLENEVNIEDYIISKRFNEKV